MTSVSVAVRNVVREVVVNRLFSSAFVPDGVRWRLYRAVGIDAQTCRIYSGAFIGSKNVSIGRRVFINHNVFIDSSARVEIGDGVSFGMNVSIITSSHQIGSSEQRAGTGTAAPVRIGKGTWLGAHVKVQPGVTIGPGCVIGSNSLVTKDCAPNGLYIGTPAKRVRDLNEAGDADFTMTDSDSSVAD